MLLSTQSALCGDIDNTTSYNSSDAEENDEYLDDTSSGNCNHNDDSSVNKIMHSIAKISSIFPSCVEDNESHGSGFFIQKDLLVTSAGLVCKDNFLPNKIIITTHDGKKYNGVLFWCDINIDIAIIKIKGGTFPAIKILRRSPKLYDNVYIFHYQDKSFGVSIGVITDLYYQYHSCPFRVYKITSDIGSTNFGTPVVYDNSVIGMIICNKSTDNAVIIPIWMIQHIVKESLKKNGKFYLPNFKVEVADSDEAHDFYSVKHGVLVKSSNMSGIIPGDLIIKINNRWIKSRFDIFEILFLLSSDSCLEIELLRKKGDGKIYECKISIPVSYNKFSFALYKRFKNFELIEHKNAVYLLNIVNINKNLLQSSKDERNLDEEHSAKNDFVDKSEKYAKINNQDVENSYADSAYGAQILYCNSVAIDGIEKFEKTYARSKDIMLILKDGSNIQVLIYNSIDR